MKLNALERIVVEFPLRRFWHLQVVRWMARNKVAAVESMLEIGCGTGHALGWLQRYFRPRRLVATDLDLRMLAAAAGRIKKPPRLGAALACADASRLPFATDSFDAVVGSGFLHHVPRWQQALAEVARVLRPGGCYFLEEFYPAAYQNWLTRRLLVHPEENRFESRDLHAELAFNAFDGIARIEWRPFYVLAVGRTAPV
ncbi:MAG: class I SAM-dependent methyltransferase [Desulfobacterales bacterium]|nr:class I SAM-dependent methyltransferase [Desulfobacterales bacterium]MDJ0854535.1 class I SAM-dependent methyltransferase [Desulfobacterales bacterium]MDJ0875186.1 class I SAM-dependent methyltransferase [Desulfobacterales bacterium]MDJ0885802.1 class I SAM-dependent methyltransferase [Desulfobacterales bacterium]MDJ0990615.1 class I SAM-dependent methyltransferase [Desulfobacterales bacterium]